MTGYCTEQKHFSDHSQGLNFEKDAIMFYFPPGQPGFTFHKGKLLGQDPLYKGVVLLSSKLPLVLQLRAPI